MSRSLLQYVKNTPNDIKIRSSNIGTKIVNGNYLVVTDIDIGEIGNIVNIGNDNLSELHDDVSINQWSNFGPYEHRVVDHNSWGFDLKIDKDLGHFAGYNHNAVEPYVEHTSIPPHREVWVGQETSFTISVGVHLGEINYPSLTGGFGVRVDVREDSSTGTLLTSHSIPDYTVGNYFTNNGGGDVSDTFPLEDIPIVVNHDNPTIYLKGFQIGNGNILPLKYDSFDLNITVRTVDIMSHGIDPTNICSVIGDVGEISTRFKNSGGEQNLFIQINTILADSINENCNGSDPNIGYTDSQGRYTGPVRIDAKLFAENGTLKYNITGLSSFIMYGGENTDLGLDVDTQWEMYSDFQGGEYVELTIYVFV